MTTALGRVRGFTHSPAPPYPASQHTPNDADILYEVRLLSPHNTGSDGKAPDDQ